MVRLKSLFLTFGDRRLEAAFQRYYYGISLARIRFTLLLGMVLYSAFGVLDVLIVPEIRRFAWSIRYLGVCPLLGLLYLLSYHKRYFRFKRLAHILGCLASGAGIVAMISRLPMPGNLIYFIGLLLCVMIFFSFVPDFIAANVAAWAVFLLYQLVLLNGSDLAGAMVFNNTFVLLTFNFCGMFICYSLERQIRAEFLQRRTIERQARELSRALVAVDKARQEAEESALTDSLTGLANRRHFLIMTRQELERKQRHLRDLALILLDIDHFKEINDAYRHLVGDQALRQTAVAIQALVRSADTACRYGGDEFAVLLPETNAAMAEEVGWRLVRAMAKMSLTTDMGPVAISISVGIAVLTPAEVVDVETFLDRADVALYAAKQEGRNRVKVWSADLGDMGPAGSNPFNHYLLED